VKKALLEKKEEVHLYLRTPQNATKKEKVRVGERANV